jgi:hypothetical protein
VRIAGVVRHARCWFFGVVALGAVGVALLAPCFAQASTRPRGTLFHLVGARTFAPVVDRKTVALQIPLTARSDVALQGLAVGLTNVELPGRAERALFEAFSVSVAPTPPAAVHAPAVLLKIDESRPLPAGLYRVRFEVLSTRPAARQGVSVNVRLSAPHLATPPTIYITKTLGSPGNDVSDSGLVLHETSGLSRLAGLTVSQVQGPGGANQQADGQVSVAPSAVPAGESRTFQVSLSGHFPHGSSTGQLEVFSPQFAEPVAVSYQVQTRMWWLWLVLLIAGGVFAGFVTRVWLVNRIQLGEAKVQGYAMLRQLEEEARNQPDAQFQKAIHVATERLERVLGEGVATDISGAVAQANKELEDARKQLQKNLPKAAKAVEALKESLSTQWDLPVSAVDVLSRQQDSLASIEAQLAAGDAEGATKESAKVSESLSRETRQAAIQWRKDALALLHLLEQKEPQILATAAPGLSAEASRAEALVSTEALTRAKPNLDELLPALHKAVGAIGSIVDQLKVASLVIGEELDRRKLSQRSETAVKAAFGRFTQALVAANQHEPATLRVVTEALQELYERLVRIRAPKTDALLRGEVSEDGMAAAAAAAVAPNSVDAAASVAAPEASFPPLTTPAAEGGSSIAAPQVMARKQLALDRAIQSAILGVIVTAIGYFLFADNFSGTAADFVAAIGWGYTADITTAFVATALAGKTSPPTAAVPAAPAAG